MEKERIKKRHELLGKLEIRQLKNEVSSNKQEILSLKNEKITIEIERDNLKLIASELIKENQSSSELK